MTNKYHVIHVAPNGRETFCRKNVSLYEANEAFYGIDNTYIVSVNEFKGLNEGKKN